MRVLQCIWRMQVGGTEKQLVRLVSGLVRRGIDVHVATALAGDDEADIGSQIHRVAPLFKYDVSTLLRLMALFRRLRPDVVQTFLTQMDIFGGMAATVLRIPWVLSERSTASAYPPTIRHRLRAIIGRRADAVVPNSPGGAEYWRGIAPAIDQIEVIPNIIPQSEIDAATPVIDPTLGDVVLYVGRFSEEKNLFTLLEALVPVLNRGKTTAVFCGEGYLRPVVEGKARTLGIADRARFLGNVANVWSWMKRASVVVAVSTFEGSPNAVLEAAAAGTPLVISDIPGYRTVLTDDAAWFVNGASPQSISEGILAALADRSEAAARAARARQLIGVRSEEQIAMRYEHLYRDVIG